MCRFFAFILVKLSPLWIENVSIRRNFSVHNKYKCNDGWTRALLTKFCPWIECTNGATITWTSTVYFLSFALALCIPHTSFSQQNSIHTRNRKIFCNTVVVRIERAKRSSTHSNYQRTKKKTYYRNSTKLNLIHVRKVSVI